MRRRSERDALGWTAKEREEFTKAIREPPIYRCPICARMGLNIENELYNRIELEWHIRLHKLTDISEELSRAVAGR